MWKNPQMSCMLLCFSNLSEVCTLSLFTPPPYTQLMMVLFREGGGEGWEGLIKEGKNIPKIEKERK